MKRALVRPPPVAGLPFPQLSPIVLVAATRFDSLPAHARGGFFHRLASAVARRAAYAWSLLGGGQRCWPAEEAAACLERWAAQPAVSPDAETRLSAQTLALAVRVAHAIGMRDPARSWAEHLRNLQESRKPDNEAIAASPVHADPALLTSTPTDLLAQQAEALLDLDRAGAAIAILELLAARQRHNGAVLAAPGAGKADLATVAHLAALWYRAGQRGPADRAMRWLRKKGSELFCGRQKRVLTPFPLRYLEAAPAGSRGLRRSRIPTPARLD